MKNRIYFLALIVGVIGCVNNNSETAYYKNGQKKSTGAFKNGKLDGWFYSYDSAYGYLDFKGFMVNGIREGDVEYYYPNGKLLSKGTYKNDKKEGICKWFYQNGKDSISAQYISGKTNGVSQYFYPNGNIKASMHLKNDTIVGVYTNYRSNGKTIEKDWYENGSPGLIAIYDINGKDSIEGEWYIDGSRKVYKDKNGKIYTIKQVLQMQEEYKAKHGGRLSN